MIEFEVNIPIKCSIDSVFNFVSHGENLSAWNSAVKRVTKITDGVTSTGTKYKMIRQLPDGRSENTIEISNNQPNTELTIRTTSGPTPFIYHYSFEGKKNSTIVSLRTEIEEEGLPFKLPKFLASRAIKSGVKDNLQTLKSILESAC
ncbi:hypothetical protein EU527_12745 [Candidatus Thorarchaeota archaeon]|nr:MAG: hypothetical protein EU527_12745 [Candidatus Thorarchaeota archaeon]